MIACIANEIIVKITDAFSIVLIDSDAIYAESSIASPDSSTKPLIVDIIPEVDVSTAFAALRASLFNFTPNASAKDSTLDMVSFMLELISLNASAMRLDVIFATSWFALLIAGKSARYNSSICISDLFALSPSAF